MVPLGSVLPIAQVGAEEDRPAGQGVTEAQSTDSVTCRQHAGLLAGSSEGLCSSLDVPPGCSSPARGRKRGVRLQHRPKLYLTEHSNTWS